MSLVCWPSQSSSPAGVELEEVEDYTNFDLMQIEKENAEMKAKLAAYRSAPSPTVPPSVEAQPDSVGAAAQADTTTLSQPSMALSVATTQVCTLGDDTDRASDSVHPAGDMYDEVCVVQQRGTSAASTGVDCHSLSPDQLDQQQPQQQQGPPSSEHRSAQRRLASTLSRFFRRSGGKTQQVQLTGKARASPVVDKGNVLADPQSQRSVSSPKHHVALTADASVQHSGQWGSRPSTAVTPIVSSLLSQAAFPVATAQHPVYSCTPPSLLWHTPAEDARSSSAMKVTNASQLPEEIKSPSLGSREVCGERAASAGAQPTFAHGAQEKHAAPPSNRYSQGQVCLFCFELPGSHACVSMTGCDSASDMEANSNACADWFCELSAQVAMCIWHLSDLLVAEHAALNAQGGEQARWQVNKVAQETQGSGQQDRQGHFCGWSISGQGPVLWPILLPILGGSCRLFSFQQQLLLSVIPSHTPSSSCVYLATRYILHDINSLLIYQTQCWVLTVQV